MSNSNKDDESSGDKWSAQANLYSNQAARLTELHGADLVTLLKEDILKASTILDVGCGTGAFAKAYLQQFPKGVPGQTLLSTDLSSGMLDKAKGSIIVGDDFQTKLVFQEEDGTKLEGIANDSVDLVVSLFGVFLIPDQDATRQAIQRVLKKGGVVGISSWQFGMSGRLAQQGFGVSLQDAFELPIKTIDPKAAAMTSGPIKKWGTREGATQILSQDYKMDNVEVSHSLHTTIWEFDTLWTMMCSNPMSNIQKASEEDVAKAKAALIQFITQNGKYSLDRPLLFSTASNLCIGRNT